MGGCRPGSVTLLGAVARLGGNGELMRVNAAPALKLQLLGKFLRDVAPVKLISGITSFEDAIQTAGDPMYKHILIPTDGTDLSRSAILQGLELAKATGARVTVVRVQGKPAHLVVLGVDITELSEDTRRRIRQEIEDHFALVHSQAAAKGVPCEAIRVESEFPWKGILETANARGCDLIAMASHGRSGLTAKLIGSETQKVLTHSTVPVLVYR